MTLTRVDIHHLAIEIITVTNDGDDLAPEHLKLVEMAVNGHLNEEGELAFQQLGEQVRSGYQKPWLHGIEHLTVDHEGFVYWKGTNVEHYSPRLIYTEFGKRHAEKLAKQCRYLEAKGEDVSGAIGVPDSEIGEVDLWRNDNRLGI